MRMWMIVIVYHFQKLRIQKFGRTGSFSSSSSFFSLILRIYVFYTLHTQSDLRQKQVYTWRCVAECWHNVSLFGAGVTWSSSITVASCMVSYCGAWTQYDWLIIVFALWRSMSWSNKRGITHCVWYFIFFSVFNGQKMVYGLGSRQKWDEVIHLRATRHTQERWTECASAMLRIIITWEGEVEDEAG